MTSERVFSQTGRKIIVTGHYGSGKTEFAVSLAMLMAAELNPAAEARGVSGREVSNSDGPDKEVLNSRVSNSDVPDINAKGAGRLAIVDLDVVNPYFRSRERREILENAGIGVYGSFYNYEVTAEMPALGATVRAPLEDVKCRVIVDAGGNDSGALALNQFIKYFTGGDTSVLAVVNANRPDTSSLEGALEHITAIESATGLTVDFIVNNCHLLRETTPGDIIKGRALCESVCARTGKTLLCDCYPAGVVDPEDLSGLSGNLMPLGLYMRPTWLDR